MSSRRLQGMSSRRLEDVFSATIFCLPRRLARGLENVLKTFSRHVLKTSGRRLEDKQIFAGLVLGEPNISIKVYISLNSFMTEAVII